MKITEGRIEKKKFEKMDSIEYRGFTISFNPMWKAYKISPYHPELGANDDFKSIDDAIDFIDRAGYDFNPKWEKVNVQEKQLQERSDLTFDVVYVNAMDSVTVEINSKNYSDVNRIENDVMEQLLKRDPNAGDDFWIDDAWCDSIDIRIDWKAILTGEGSRLDQDMVDFLFDNPTGKDTEEIVACLAFLDSEGYNLYPNNLENMINKCSVVEDDGKYEYSNDNRKYPTEWIYDEFEVFFPDLYNALEKANALDYFDVANIFRDMELNGDIIAGYFGDYFVYSYDLK